jgi:hypothetical protein
MVLDFDGTRYSACTVTGEDVSPVPLALTTTLPALLFERTMIGQ